MNEQQEIPGTETELSTLADRVLDAKLRANTAKENLDELQEQMKDQLDAQGLESVTHKGYVFFRRKRAASDTLVVKELTH